MLDFDVYLEKKTSQDSTSEYWVPHYHRNN